MGVWGFAPTSVAGINARDVSAHVRMLGGRHCLCFFPCVVSLTLRVKQFLYLQAKACGPCPNALVCAGSQRLSSRYPDYHQMLLSRGVPAKLRTMAGCCIRRHYSCAQARYLYLSGLAWPLVADTASARVACASREGCNTRQNELRPHREPHAQTQPFPRGKIN